MKLAAFFASVAPMLTGRASADETARTLYGGDPAHALDAARLSIYAELCGIHRNEALEGVHEETARAVRRLAGERAWEQLVADYFAAHPMHSAELNENGAALAPWLGEQGASRGLPAWIAELADFEQWEWRTLIAPDGDDGQDAPQRLAGAVELRPYRHDLVAWLDAEERAASPQVRDVFVLFWLDRDLRLRRENATPRELLVLQAVHAGTPVDPALHGTLADLRRAGIVVGAP